MSKNELETIINQAWEKKEEVNKNSNKSIIDAINQTIADLDSGVARVAEKVKKINSNIKIIHYVAPSVWAWRPERAFKMSKFVDHVLALLPFEPPYMEAEGMTSDFVGHPVVNLSLIHISEPTRPY